MKLKSNRIHNIYHFLVTSVLTAIMLWLIIACIMPNGWVFAKSYASGDLNADVQVDVFDLVIARKSGQVAVSGENANTYLNEAKAIQEFILEKPVSSPITVNPSATASALEIVDGKTDLTNLIQGKGRSVYGTVTSNYPIAFVKAGIACNGYSSYAETVPFTTEFDVHSLDADIDFGNAPFGLGKYVIYARDTSGKETQLEQPFTISPSIASILKITNSTDLTGLTEGQGRSVKGLVESNYPITEVKVGIYSAKTGGTAYTEATYSNTVAKAELKNDTFDINALDAKVIFGDAKVGTCYFRIYAKDVSGKELTDVKEFTVSPKQVASTLKIANALVPTDIKQGSIFNIGGTITADNSIVNVTVGVYSSETGGTAFSGTYKSDDLTTVVKTYDVKAKLNNDVGFNSLATGTYYYRLTAKEKFPDGTVVEKVLVNQKFTVTPKSTASGFVPIEYTATEINNFVTAVGNASAIKSEKKNSCKQVSEALLKAGFDKRFVVGVLANICSEGDFGKFEYYNSNTPQSYILAIPSTYGYTKNYSGKHIYDSGINFTTVEKMINERVATGTANIFGLGCVQWTANERVRELVKLYRKKIGSSRTTITLDETAAAECELIVGELTNTIKTNMNYLDDVYMKWVNSGTKTPYNAAKIFCITFEAPGGATTKAVERGNLATTIYNEIIK